MTVRARAQAQVNSEAPSLGSVFAVLWACANVAHLLNLVRAGDLPVVWWVNLACALWLLARPGSSGRLVLLACAQLFETVWMAPYVPDHQILAAFINVTILAAYVRSGRAPSTSTLVERISPAARVILLVAYSAAAVSKYNWDFLTPLQSCASFMAQASSFGVIERDSALAVGYVVMTIVAETSIPILLLLRVTRRWGVLYACTFHFLVSLSPITAVMDFTATLWALLLLFLPREDLEEIGGRITTELRRSRVVSLVRGFPAPVLVAAALLAVLGGSLVASGFFVFLVLWALVTTLGASLLLCTLRVLRSNRRQPPSIGPLSPGQVLVVLSLVVLVAGPYLGSGTSSRFTMFSGVRTEGPGTNHVFLPSLHLVDSQEESLVVLESHGDSDTLDSAAEHNAALPVVEINRILQDDQISAKFQTLDGRQIEVRRGQDHPLRESPNWWEAKTQHYRPFTVKGITDPGFCSN